MRRWLLVIGLLLATPGATAESRTWGEVTAGSLTLERADLQVAGYLNLTHELLLGADVSWTAAEGRHVRTNYTAYTPPVTIPEVGSGRLHPVPPQRAPMRVAEARIVSVECGPACALVLFTTPESWFLLPGSENARLDKVELEAIVWAESENEKPDGFRRRFSPESYRISRLETPAIETSGAMTLLIKDALVVIEFNDSRRTSIDTLHGYDRSAESAGVLRYESAFAELNLTGVALGLRNIPVDFIGETIRADSVARMRLDDASGWLMGPQGRIEFDGTRVEMDGTSRFATKITRTGIATLVEERSVITLGGATTQLTIDGASIITPPPNDGAAIVGATFALTALLAIAARLAIVPLYSRIALGRVLENPNRAALHALIGRTPGSGVAALSRESNLSRAVVRHHLAMLEAHRLIVARRAGFRQEYYPAAVAPEPQAYSTRALLSDPTRREIALTIAESPTGLTQKDIVARTGRSQRLVSHHLQKLEAAGLVASDGARPARYSCTPQLHDLSNEAASARGSAA